MILSPLELILRVNFVFPYLLLKLLYIAQWLFLVFFCILNLSQYKLFFIYLSL